MSEYINIREDFNQDSMLHPNRRVKKCSFKRPLKMVEGLKKVNLMNESIMRILESLPESCRCITKEKRVVRLTYIPIERVYQVEYEDEESENEDD